MNWVRRIEARGSQGDVYTVAISDTGAWGCSCPAWRFKKKDHATGLRPDCKHIVAVKAVLPASRQDRFAGLDYAKRVRKYEREGLTTSDAQAVVDAQQSKLPDIGARFRYLDLDMTVTL